jgi:hypothetical protein
MRISVPTLALKRAKYLVGALLILAVAPELVSRDGFQWSQIVLESRVILGYWIVTTFRDWQDPEIPNK